MLVTSRRNGGGIQAWADGRAEILIRCLSRMMHDRVVRDKLLAQHWKETKQVLPRGDAEALAAAREQHELFKARATGEV